MTVAAWDNETRPKGAGNTRRPLTRSSDFGREGLAMKATTRTCSIDGCTKPVIARGWCTPVSHPMSATVDHIVPVSDAASEHSYANTQLAHFDCNRRKAAAKESA